MDFLAVAVGTAHGLYEGTPHLDLDLLAEIRSRVAIPLVLHGGTGLSDAQFQGAIQAGISKINVATDLFVTAAQRMADAALEPKASFFKIGSACTNAVKERASYYLALFGASNRAGSS